MVSTHAYRFALTGWMKILVFCWKLAVRSRYWAWSGGAHACVGEVFGQWRAGADVLMDPEGSSRGERFIHMLNFLMVWSASYQLWASLFNACLVIIPSVKCCVCNMDNSVICSSEGHLGSGKYLVHVDEASFAFCVENSFSNLAVGCFDS